jgi:SAM-dependent methyltransferase
MPSDALAAYGRRAAEYAEHLGLMSSVHPSDVHLVTTWADSVDGPLLDAGCGPGHWTAHLAGQGIDVRGVDQVPAFIDHARSTYAEVPFTLGSIVDLEDPADTYGGVLAWYSLIHHEPSAIRRPLDEFARVLRPSGHLLVGFFLGDALELFDHAVVTAWRWPADLFVQELEAAGFDLIETHTRTAASGTPRPHGAIVARLKGTDQAPS